MAIARLPFNALDLPEDAVSESLRWARRAGHPNYLWPETLPDAWRRARELLADLFTRVLSDPDADGALRFVRPEGLAARAVGLAAFTEGVGPLLGQWNEIGRIETDDETAAIFDLHLRHGRARAERSAAALSAAVSLLAGVGLPVVVLKGAHTGHTLFPEPGVRPSADIDLLVPRERFTEAERALEHAGYRPGTRKTEPPTREWVPPGGDPAIRSLELAHADHVIGIDLHGSLDRDFYRVGTVRLGEPGPGERTRFPGFPGAWVLSEPLLSAFLGAHTSHGLHNLTLIRLTELAFAIRDGRRSGHLDWQALEARLAAANGLRFVLPAFLLTEQLLPGTVDAGFLERLRSAAPPGVRQVVDSLRPGSAYSLDRLHLDERFMWGRSPLEHAKRLLDTAWPRSEGGSWPRLARIWRHRLASVLGGRVAIGRKRQSGSETAD